MGTVTFSEYEAAKNEIIFGVEYQEETQFPNQWGMSSKQYHTAENGNFYEVTDPNTGITEFWSDKNPTSRYYDGRTREGIIAQYEARIAAIEAASVAEKKNQYCEGAKASVQWYPAIEYKGRKFKIFREENDPYPNQKPADEIELSGAEYIGGDLYIVPMQVYETENPALLRLVFLVADLSYSPAIETTFAEITENNIRTAFMTRDKKVFYHTGAMDCSGTYDLTPQPQRLES